jgi:hypothetical protein
MGCGAPLVRFPLHIVADGRLLCGLACRPEYAVSPADALGICANAGDARALDGDLEMERSAHRVERFAALYGIDRS